MAKIDVTELDIFYISYDEPNCEEHWADLLNKVPWAKRVHGVKGFDAAHKAAAADHCPHPYEGESGHHDSDDHPQNVSRSHVIAKHRVVVENDGWYDFPAVRSDLRVRIEVHPFHYKDGLVERYGALP